MSGLKLNLRVAYRRIAAVSVDALGPIQRPVDRREYGGLALVVFGASTRWILRNTGRRRTISANAHNLGICDIEPLRLIFQYGPSSVIW